MGRMCAIILCFSPEFIPISRHLPYLSIYTLVFFHKIFSAKLSVCLCWAKGAKNKKKVVGQSLMRHETPFGLAACARPTATQQLDQSFVVVIVMVMGQGKVCQIAEEWGGGREGRYTPLRSGRRHKKALTALGRSKLFSHKVGRSDEYFMHFKTLQNCFPRCASNKFNVCETETNRERARK